MKAKVTLIGNEGFLIEAGATRILIDAFYGAIPGLASAAALGADNIAKADLILVTHDHWDHFSAREVADMANRTGASVVGPASVINQLRGKVPAEALVKLEPLSARKGVALSAKTELPAATITAFRTFHAMGHNSYLVETPTFRFFHDGDNEDTRRIDPAALVGTANAPNAANPESHSPDSQDSRFAPARGRLDALFIGPWQGSGWVDFIEKLSPARWFLMHLSEEELDQHEAGKFLPDLCDHVPLPDRLVVLRPGQSFIFP